MISRRDFLKLAALSSCVNASPEDAKWIFRWSLPQVPYDPGDVTVEWPGGTKVSVEDQSL